MSKLTVHNNWGSLEYRFAEKKVDSHKGGRCTLKHVDGTTEDVDYKPETYVEHVNDMGRESIVTSNQLVAILKYHGTEIYVPLEKLNVQQLITDK